MITVIGSIGLFVLLLAFTLNSLKKLTQESLTYNLFNLVGAGILAYYAYSLKSYVFIVLEATWALIALYSIIKTQINK